MFGLFKKFKEGLSRTAAKTLGVLGGMFARNIDESDIEKIEEALLGADFGYETSELVVGEIRNQYRRDKSLKGLQAAQIGASVLGKILEKSEADFAENTDTAKPSVICLVGVNGAGKTTTCAKLAHMFASRGQKCVIGECDTFRAAANEQMSEWARRLGLDLVQSAHGADSAAVAFDAWTSAKAKGAKWLILDTAGRLHTKENLMAELGKLARVLKKLDPTAPQNAVIVLDASLGGNSIEQARAFNKVFPLTGMIITKLDGTSRGGALAGIYSSLKLPVLYAGLGEKPEDLRKFNINAYVNGVFGLEGENEQGNS